METVVCEVFRALIRLCMYDVAVTPVCGESVRSSIGRLSHPCDLCVLMPQSREIFGTLPFLIVKILHSARETFCNKCAMISHVFSRRVVKPNTHIHAFSFPEDHTDYFPIPIHFPTTALCPTHSASDLHFVVRSVRSHQSWPLRYSCPEALRIPAESDRPAAQGACALDAGRRVSDLLWPEMGSGGGGERWEAVGRGERYSSGRRRSTWKRWVKYRGGNWRKGWERFCAQW